MKTIVSIVVLLLAINVESICQSLNLQQLLNEKRLTTNKPITSFIDGDKKGISTNGIVWLEGFNFSIGTIEVDLRGRDVPQQSFLGIAFHEVDTITYEAIYFRPFNFQSTDSVKKIHAVQYISHPEYTWKKLREEKNGIYEKGINPSPNPTQWFHARIVVDAATISVYVNGAALPSLHINRLTNHNEGKIGLWNFTSGLPGDFANLRVKKQ